MDSNCPKNIFNFESYSRRRRSSVDAMLEPRIPVHILLGSRPYSPTMVGHSRPTISLNALFQAVNRHRNQAVQKKQLQGMINFNNDIISQPPSSPPRTPPHIILRSIPSSPKMLGHKARRTISWNALFQAVNCERNQAMQKEQLRGMINSDNDIISDPPSPPPRNQAMQEEQSHGMINFDSDIILQPLSPPRNQPMQEEHLHKPPSTTPPPPPPRNQAMQGEQLHGMINFDDDIISEPPSPPRNQAMQEEQLHEPPSTPPPPPRNQAMREEQLHGMINVDNDTISEPPSPPRNQAMQEQQLHQPPSTPPLTPPPPPRNQVMKEEQLHGMINFDNDIISEPPSPPRNQAMQEEQFHWMTDFNDDIISQPPSPPSPPPLTPLPRIPDHILFGSEQYSPTILDHNALIQALNRLQNQAMQEEQLYEMINFTDDDIITQPPTPPSYYDHYQWM